jgi:hypothetical protein
MLDSAIWRTHYNILTFDALIFNAEAVGELAAARSLVQRSTFDGHAGAGALAATVPARLRVRHRTGRRVGPTSTGAGRGRSATADGRSAVGETLGFDEDELVRSALDVESAVASVVQLFDESRCEVERTERQDVSDDEEKTEGDVTTAMTTNVARSNG